MSEKISVQLECTPNSIIFVQNSSQLVNLKRGTKIHYFCQKCGAEVVQGFKRNGDFRLFCVNCKKKDTTLKNYGVDNPAKSKEIYQKIKDTNISRYGHTCSRWGDNPSEKAKTTSIKNYGTEFPVKSKKFQEEFKSKLLDKYGVDCTFKINNGYEKSKETRLKKYGSSMGLQAIFHLDGLKFDSFWEVAFYVYHRDNNNEIIRDPCILFFTVNGKQHRYLPDFSLNGKFFEIKSNYWIKKQSEGSYGEAKFRCMQENNVTIISDKEIIPYLEYVNSKYGKNFFNKFKEDFKNRK